MKLCHLSLEEAEAKRVIDAIDVVIELETSDPVWFEEVREGIRGNDIRAIKEVALLAGARSKLQHARTEEYPVK